MSRLQAVIKIKDVEVKNINDSTKLYTITGFERCFSKNRKHAQEKYDIPKEKKDGVYFMWHTIKVFVTRDVGLMSKMESGAVIDFSGRLEEEVWIDKDGEVRKKPMIINPDINVVQFADNGRERGERREDRSLKSDDSLDDDDLPF